MRMTFLGGAGTVTGSCYALEVAGRTILLDCGQFQGTRAEEARNREPLPIDVGAIAAVVLGADEDASRVGQIVELEQHADTCSCGCTAGMRSCVQDLAAGHGAGNSSR